MKLSLEQKINILQESYEECGLDGHIVVSKTKGELSTAAEKTAGYFDWYANMPHKNSYLYFDSVDACFYITESGIASVTFTAKWIAGSKDLDNVKFLNALAMINKLLDTMQKKIDSITGHDKDSMKNGGTLC